MGQINNPDLILVAVIVGITAISFFLAQRGNTSRFMRASGVWVLVFLGAIIVIGFWDDLRQATERVSVAQDGSEVRVAQAYDGHFYLTLEVNAVPVRFVVDTGATDLVLSRRDAEKAGLDPDAFPYTGRAMTANGMVETAPVRLDSVAIGPVEDRNVRAVIIDSELGESLLGMGYLSRFGTIIIEDGELILRR